MTDVERFGITSVGTFGMTSVGSCGEERFQQLGDSGLVHRFSIVD